MKNRGLFCAAGAALFVVSCAINAHCLNLPPDTVNIAVRPGTVSFFDATLSSVPSGYGIANGTYAAWCVDRFNDNNPAENGGAHTGYLLVAGGGGLPDSYSDVPWDKINYLLNHKIGTIDDVQHALWYFTDGIAPDTMLAPLAPALIADTEAHGAGFVPGPGQVTAVFVVWVEPSPLFQGNIIEVPGPPDVEDGDCSDRFTAGGFIYRDGSKVSFGIQGGMKNGSLAGGINLVDHGLKMHVQSRTITSYRAIDAFCREAIYDCVIDGAAGTATVVVCDYGEPGRNDVVEITLSNGYTAGQGTTLGGDRKGGGNVQLHKANCHEPPKAKPNRGGAKPKKPGSGADGGKGNSSGNVITSSGGPATTVGGNTTVSGNGKAGGKSNNGGGKANGKKKVTLGR